MMSELIIRGMMEKLLTIYIYIYHIVSMFFNPMEKIAVDTESTLRYKYDCHEHEPII